MKRIEIAVCRGFDGKLYEKLCDGLQKKFGECEFIKTVDESFLGGFTVTVDATVYDRTVKSKLKQLKTHIEN